MANKTIPMLYLRRIIQLKQTGISNRRIAKILGIDRKTVNDYSCRIKQFDHNLSSRLVEKISLAKIDGSYIELLNQMEKIPLIFIDDFGLVPMDSNTRLTLLQLLRRSI